MAKSKSSGFSVAGFKKHYFWAVLPTLLIAAFVISSIAHSAIKKKFDEKKTAVETEKTGIDSVASDSKHPNDETIEAIKKETDILKKSVFEAWTLMYTDQKMRNRWPRKLSREFLTLVESLKFRSPIDPTKPHLREDYSFFIGNHLPELLKQLGRRRCQVHDYKYVEREKKFFPVYEDKEKGTYYILITEGEAPAEKVKEVQVYDVKRDLLTKVTDSSERARLTSQERVPYYREMDPWIVTPKDYMTFGSLASMGMMGGMSGDMSGGLGPGMGPGMSGGMGPGPGMSGGMGPAGGAAGAMAGPGAPGMSGDGARGSMDGMGGMGGMTSGVAIPGEGIDPALEQLPGSSNANVGGDALGGGMAAAPAMGPARAGGGMAGVGRSTGSDVSYPGLPPYIERKRIVGNVDWTNPEIYSLPTWSQGGYPKSIEIWYAQESLWVYEALLRIITETNKTSPDNIANAPVKSIEAILIGQQAATAWQVLDFAVGDLTGASMMSSSMGMSGMGMEAGAGSDSSAGGAGISGSADMEGSMGATELTEEDILKRILFGRYLNAENEPLPADEVPPFAEFNKMPVCMKLIIDQRRIPDLLVNCANCSMPIDIKHIRICPDNAIPFSPAGAGGMGAGMEGGMSAGMPGMSSGMGPGAAGPAMSGGAGMSGGPSAASASGPRGGMDEMGGGGMSGVGNIDVGRSEISQIAGYGVDAIRVEVYGIINIFNEPNLSEFGTGSKTSEKDTGMTEETLNAPTVGEAQQAKEANADSVVTPATGTPGATSATATPVAETPAAKPATGTPAAKPATGTPAAKPATGTPAATPATGTPAAKPATGTPAATPATGTPAAKPATGTPAATPATGTPAATPATGTPAATPATGTPAAKPAAGT